jgi:hypothetical protein
MMGKNTSTIVTEAWHGKEVICFLETEHKTLRLLSGTFESFEDYVNDHPNNRKYVQVHMHDWLARNVK